MFAMLALVACGGGGDDDDDDDNGDDPTATTEAEPEPTTSPELSTAEIIEANKNSVVNIITTTPQGDGGGSGVVWEDSQHILTNAHVVIGAGAIKVADPENPNRTYAARVVALSACDDVALLEVDRGPFEPAAWADSEEIGAGDDVVTLGFPGTLSGSDDIVVTEGIVSRVNATYDFEGFDDLIQHTAPINPGNSGGPLFNMRGEVIGLNTFYAIGAQNENYAITSNEALFVAEQLRDGENLDYIGVSVARNYEDLAYAWDLAYIDGLVVTGVDPGSPADEADPYPFIWGDLIFSVDSTPVYTVGDFCDIIRSRNAGQTIEVQVGNWDSNGEPFNNFRTQVVLR
jgi:serine protease Do